jgi:ribosome-binding protein aMBF1 (putative translation factor)
MRCFKCDATKSNAILFDVISLKGIVQICNACYKNENLPIVESNGFREKADEKFKTVHERLVSASGLDKVRQKTFEENKAILKQNTDLKNVVDANFKKTLEDVEQRDDLIQNFHWVIMRARRLKHVTQKKLAEIIAEPELSIKMLEKGVVSKDSDALIQKIERYLEINLFDRKQMKVEEPTTVEKLEEFSMDDPKNQDLVISDLKESATVKKTPFWKSWGKKDDSLEVANLEEVEVEPYSSKEVLEKSELSEKEIDDILFGK